MLTKEISFTLPIIICLYEFIFLKANLKKRLLYLFPFLLSFALIPFQLLVTKSLFGTANNISATLQLANEYNLTWSEYLFTQFRVIITYIRLMLFPANQNLDYDYPTFHTFFTPPVLFSFICLLSISCIALFLLHRSSLIKKHSTHLRLIAFGIFWFFITLSVESSIIPIDDVIFEHRLYLPSVGLIVSIIMGLLLLTDKFSITKPNSAKIIIAAMIIIVVPFSAASYSRNAIWHSEISLWEDVVLKSPQKARPHSNLGQAYLADGRLDEAAKELLVAIQLKPDLAEAHNNLGVAYMDQNRYEDATKEFLWVLKRNPYYRFTHNNMGLVNLRQNKLDAAAMYLRNALKLNPDYTDARYNLALTLEKQGKIDEAIKEYRSVLIHTPTLLNKINNFGTCRLGAGKLDEAITKFQVVLTLDPNFVQAHYNLGLAYSKQGHYQQAIQEFRTAIRLKPDLAIAHYKLALMYEKQNKSGEAVLELEHAVKLKPDYSEALSKLELLRNPAKKQQINK
jgi:tetratricopeptide (TPR) repeat protein